MSTKKMIICGLLAFSVNGFASKNYNHSYIDIRGGIHDIEVAGQKLDGANFGFGAKYEFAMIPLILGAGLNKGWIKSGERGIYDKWESFSYSAGAQLVLSPISRLDLLPGVAIGRAEDEKKIGAVTATTKSTYYQYGLDSRFHFDKGLWFALGVSRSNYNLDAFKDATIYKIGLDYSPTDEWALGYEHVRTSEQSSNTLFLRFFY